MRRDVGRSTRAVLIALMVLTIGLATGCSSDSGSSTGTPSGSPSVPTLPTVPPASPTPGPVTSSAGSSTPPPSTPPPSTAPSEEPTNFPDSDLLAPTVATTDLKTIAISELPAQARVTLQTIKDGGPFPYPNDGIIFENREKRLPQQDYGFYHEYTVKTPGSSDRGARRIVTGADGSRFWTADHYTTFREVIAS